MVLCLLFNFWLATASIQSYVVMGTVRDQAGQAVSGVRISVVDENFQSVRSLFVDNSGRFTVRGLVTGRYTFRVETTGTTYEELSQSVELYAVRVRPGTVETISVDFVLKPKKSSNSPQPKSSVFVQEIPNAAKVQYERATNSLKKGDAEQTIGALKKAVELFPSYFDALELLGTEYVKHGKFEFALPPLTKALEINPRAPKSLYAQGVAHLKLNHTTEAIESLKRATELAPNNPNAPMMLGLAYRQLQDLKLAEVAFKKALQIGGAMMAEAHFYLAGIYEKQAMYSEAVRELELFLKEVKDISNRDQIKSAIEKLRVKANETQK